MYYKCDRCKKAFSPYLRQTLWFCNQCKDKNEILFEGTLIKIDLEGEIEPGDIYLARRNTKWKLLTCKENNKVNGFIVPVENAYIFDTHECFKVVGL